MESLQDKTLIILVGPTAIGKSTLMNKVIRLHPEFGRVTGFTTRGPRPNDEPGQYRYLIKEEVERKIANNELVQYAIFPTTKQIYGTEILDYVKTYNIKDILANAVDSFRLLPFQKTITISLTAPAQEWRKWFLSRYPKPSDEAMKRLEEAKLSIEWSLSDTETYWLENLPDHLANTAQALIDIAIDQPPRVVPEDPAAILQLIEKGIWT